MSLRLMVRSGFAAVAATLTLVGGSVVQAQQAPGTPCGDNSVITDNHTCAAFNSPCSGYDMMIVGRVDHQGMCVVPGTNGTTF